VTTVNEEAVKALHPAELAAEDVSEISWEDMIDGVSINPQAGVVQSVECSSSSDPTLHCDTLA
jgi:hypothetical protein